MKKFFWRAALVAAGAVVVTACGNKETRQALDKSSELVKQKQYMDANEVLLEALSARESQVRGGTFNASDSATAEAMIKKVQADSEYLKLERAQIPLYLRLERPDMAASVYNDILKGSPGDKVIADEVHDPDALIRKGAVQVLGLIGRRDSVTELAAATRDSDQEVRRAAASALGLTKDPQAVPPLIAELKDSFWFARAEAASALSEVPDARAVPPLLDAVGDSDNMVSGAAHNSLVLMTRAKDTTVRPDDLAARLNDPNADIAITAAECLGMLHDPRATPVLLKLVTTGDPTVRLAAVRGLGESGDRAALPTLRQTLKDPDPNMRGWSIIGLGELQDEDSLIDLEHIATDDTQPPEIRAAANASADRIKKSLPPVDAPDPSTGNN